jgi:hypothetical protein
MQSSVFKVGNSGELRNELKLRMADYDDLVTEGTAAMSAAPSLAEALHGTNFAIESEIFDNGPAIASLTRIYSSRPCFRCSTPY